MTKNSKSFVFCVKSKFILCMSDHRKIKVRIKFNVIQT